MNVEHHAKGLQFTVGKYLQEVTQGQCWKIHFPSPWHSSLFSFPVTLIMKVQVIEDWLNNLCTFILTTEGQVKVKQNQSNVKKRWQYKAFGLRTQRNSSFFWWISENLKRLKGRHTFLWTIDLILFSWFPGYEKKMKFELNLFILNSHSFYLLFSEEKWVEITNYFCSNCIFK